MKKRLQGMLVLVLACTLLFTACGNGASSANSDAPQSASGAGSGKPGEGIRIAYVVTTGGLGDGALADACYNGLLKAQEKLGFEMDYSEPMSHPDYEAFLLEYCESGEYDLIFCAGFDGLDPINTVGPDFPDQKFILYDIEESGNEQLVSEFFSKNEIGFMAGVFAALLDEKGEVTINGNTTSFESTGKLGLIIGEELPSTLGAITGAAAGARYINPESDYLYAIAGDWSDQAKNKELALSMYDQGAHFIFQNAGGGALGIVAAAKERGEFFLGYDTDQNGWDLEHVVGSARKANDATIMRIIETFCTTGELPWGVAENNKASNDGIMFTYNPGIEVSEEITAIMDQVYDDLKTGKIAAPNTWEEVEAFDAVLER